MSKGDLVMPQAICFQERLSYPGMDRANMSCLDSLSNVEEGFLKSQSSSGGVSSQFSYNPKPFDKLSRSGKTRFQTGIFAAASPAKPNPYNKDSISLLPLVGLPLLIFGPKGAAAYLFLLAACGTGFRKETPLTPEQEVCDGEDNDGDGEVDEGVINACGTCGPVPEEVCDEVDNDCDGQIDEGFNLQADPSNCGVCGNICSFDNVLAACVGGECRIQNCLEGWNNANRIEEDGCECRPGDATPEVCDEVDNDCDGEVDEGEVCPPSVDWTKTHNGPADGLDIGTDIAVDYSGNVYVTGAECVEINEDGTCNLDIWIRKYKANGDELWTISPNGFGIGWDIGLAIDVDNYRNVYVLGELEIDDGLTYWIGKYDADGTPLWTIPENDSADDNVDISDVAVDSHGNVYVTGSVFVPGESWNIWVRKYDTDGNPLWTTTHNGPANHYDTGLGIAVDNYGNPYVTGFVTVAGEGNNIWVGKYDTTNGNELWTDTYDGITRNNEAGVDIAIDNYGNAYVSGNCDYTREVGWKYWLGKYSSIGERLRTRKFEGNRTIQQVSDGWSIAVDNYGGVYIGGYEYTDGEWKNILIRKFDTDFNDLWTDTYNGSDNEDDQGFGITVGYDVSVYVTGGEFVQGEDYNIWVRKYMSPNQIQR